MPNGSCPICTGPADLQRTGDRVKLNCDICGHAIITGTAESLLRNDASGLRPFLSAHIRQENERGITPRMDESTWRACAEGHTHTTVPTKLRRLLEYLGRVSKRPGDKVQIPANIHPLFDATESAEVGYLLETLRDRGDIKGPQNGWIVTAQGWERLDPVAGGGVRGTCFIAMSFDPSLDEAYRDGLMPAIRDAGFTGGRVDEVPHNAEITDRIRAGIRSAQLVITDFTGQRQGVYYEAGFAEGLGRAVIRTCRADDFSNLHFDTRQFFHLKWNTPADLRVALTEHIKATVGMGAGSSSRTLP